MQMFSLAEGSVRTWQEQGPRPRADTTPGVSRSSAFQPSAISNNILQLDVRSLFTLSYPCEVKLLTEQQISKQFSGGAPSRR